MSDAALSAGLKCFLVFAYLYFVFVCFKLFPGALHNNLPCLFLSSWSSEVYIFSYLSLQVNHLIILAGSVLNSLQLTSYRSELAWTEHNCLKLTTTLIVIPFFASLWCNFCRFFQTDLWKITCWSTSPILISLIYLITMCLWICSKWLKWYPKDLLNVPHLIFNFIFTVILQNDKNPAQFFVFQNNAENFWFF